MYQPMVSVNSRHTRAQQWLVVCACGYDALCTDEGKMLMNVLGGIEVILEVMRGHRGETELLTQAMGVLRSVSVNGECRQHVL